METVSLPNLPCHLRIQKGRRQKAKTMQHTEEVKEDVDTSVDDDETTAREKHRELPHPAIQGPQSYRC